MSGFDYPPCRCTCEPDHICLACLQAQARTPVEVSLRAQARPIVKVSVPRRGRRRQAVPLSLRQADLRQRTASYLAQHGRLPQSADLHGVPVPRGLSLTVVLHVYGSVRALWHGCLIHEICTEADVLAALHTRTTAMTEQRRRSARTRQARATRQRGARLSRR